MAKQPQGISTQKQISPREDFLLCLQTMNSHQEPWTLITESKLEQTGAMTKAIPRKSLFTLMSDV